MTRPSSVVFAVVMVWPSGFGGSRPWGAGDGITRRPDGAGHGPGRLTAKEEGQENLTETSDRKGAPSRFLDRFHRESGVVVSRAAQRWHSARP
jgi:hypothetical protein